MANWYVNSVAWTAVTAWAASTTYSIGDLRRQLAAQTAGNERVFRCTTAGTSGGSEPSWNRSHGATTSDGTAVWTEVTGQETYQSAGAWGAPHARLENAFASGWGAAGDSFMMSSNHAQTQAGGVTCTSPGTVSNPCFLYVVDESGSGHVPPQSGDVKTGGSINTTGANAITFDAGVLAVDGLTLNGGDSSSSGQIAVATASGAVHRWRNSTWNRRGTGGSSNAVVTGSGAAGTDGDIYLENHTISFGNANDAINQRNTRLTWKGGSITGTAPTNLFSDGASVEGGFALLENVDLSLMGSGKTIVPALEFPRDITFKNCKLNASVTVAATPTKPGYAATYVVQSDSAAKNNRLEKYHYYGTQTTESVVVRTSGAGDGTTGFSVKIVTTANAKWAFPFEALPIPCFNGTTGSNVTVTIEGLWNAAALPNNDDIWFDVGYMGSSSTPLGSIATGTKVNNLASGSALTASTQAWDSQATARANSHAYSVGDIIKVASNTGRIFFCTTAGTSAGSEPGGFASAVDGGSVTDGGAVFRAAVRFKHAVTLSSPQPGMIGALYAYPRAGKPSTTFYLDPVTKLS